MPCSSCTTGSPMRTSERSRTIASTLLRLRGLARGAAHHTGVQLAFGDERDLAFGPLESDADWRRHQHGVLLRQEHAGKAVHEVRMEVVFGEVVLHRLAAAGTLRDDRDLVRRCGDVSLQRGERVVRAPVHLHRSRRARGPAVAACNLDARERLDRAVEGVGCDRRARSAEGADAPCRRAAGGNAIRCPARTARLRLARRRARR